MAEIWWIAIAAAGLFVAVLLIRKYDRVKFWLKLPGGVEGRAEGSRPGDAGKGGSGTGAPADPERGPRRTEASGDGAIAIGGSADGARIETNVEKRGRRRAEDP